MLGLLITGMFMIHLNSCFWYLSAKLYDFDENTWVHRYLEQNPSLEQTGVYMYFISIYWSL